MYSHIIHGIKKLHLHDGCSDIHYSPTRRISTKPSASDVAHGMWMANVHSAGSSPRHRLSDLQKPPATMVCESAKCVLHQAPKNWQRMYGRSTVEIGTYPQKQKPPVQDPFYTRMYEYEVGPAPGPNQPAVSYLSQK